MKKKTNSILTTNEFNLLCDLYNGGFFTSLDTINWRDSLFPDNDIHLLKSKWKVNSKNLLKKVNALSSLNTLELLIEIQKFWKTDDSIYESLNILSPRKKIDEILSDPKRSQLVQWPGIHPVDLFYLDCQQLDLDFIIHSQDTTGENKYTWGVSRYFLHDFILSLSKGHQFCNILRLNDAILHGFRA